MTKSTSKVADNAQPTKVANPDEILSPAAEAQESEPKRPAVRKIRVLEPGYRGILNTRGQLIEPGIYEETDPRVRGAVPGMLNVGRAIIVEEPEEYEPPANLFERKGFSFTRDDLIEMTGPANDRSNELRQLCRAYGVFVKGNMEALDMVEFLLDHYAQYLRDSGQDVPEELETNGLEAQG